MSCDNSFFKSGKSSQLSPGLVQIKNPSLKNNDREPDEKAQLPLSSDIKTKLATFTRDHRSIFGGLSALVVDDSTHFQKTHSKFLITLGFKQCFVANNGQHALELLQQLGRDGIVINVICMDIEMPIMNGLDATREIVKRQLAPQAIVIMLSSNDSASDISTAFTAGAVAYLPKPISILDLGETIIKNVKLPGPSSTVAPASEASSKLLLGRP